MMLTDLQELYVKDLYAKKLGKIIAPTNILTSSTKEGQTITISGVITADENSVISQGFILEIEIQNDSG